MNIISGFEPTRIINEEKKLESFDDVLENSEHFYNFKQDFDLVKKIGIETLRVAIPWHRIEHKEGEYDWTWTDDYMSSLRERNIDPILDPLHHVSIPSWLTGGFLDDRFVDSYSKFFVAVMRRYYWVNKFTIVNEPLVTTYFACYEGIWYPFAKGQENFQKGLGNIFKIYQNVAGILRKYGKEHWYVDASEHHRGTCDSSNCFATERNEFHRFQLLDRLVAAGIYITVLGLDYYPHCEFQWCDKGRVDHEDPLGFYEIAKQYVKRYNLPIALTETNIRGFDTDRISWFVYMWKECEKLEKEVDFRGFCWYPFIDCTDWDTLVRFPNKNIDPQGIVHLDDDFNRVENKFCTVVNYMTQPESCIDAVKKYKFQPPLDHQLKGFISKHMKDWKWSDI